MTKLRLYLGDSVTSSKGEIRGVLVVKTFRIFIIFNFWVFIGAALFGCAPQSHFQNEFQEEVQDGELQALIGGSPVNRRTTRAAKSVVYIEFLNQHQQHLASCTATLIAPQTVLTAAHCFDSKRIPMESFRVVFESRGGSQGKRKVLRGHRFSKHPRYNKQKLLDHDIAVAVFEGEVPSGFVAVDMDSDIHANYANQKVYVYGFGRFDDKSSHEKKSGLLRRGLMTVGLEYNKYPDRYITSAESDTFLCMGDSGGPQFYHEAGVLKIIGVNSGTFGGVGPDGQKTCRGLAQATKVAPFYDWIKTEQKKLLDRMR